MHDLHLTLPLLQRHERCLTGFLVLLLGSKQISLGLRFDRCNLPLPHLFSRRNFPFPHLLLLPTRSSSLMHATPQLCHYLLPLLQLHQHVPLLLLRLSPQCCMRIAKARNVIYGPRLCGCSLSLVNMREVRGGATALLLNDGGF
jgi:hypothetical protein